MSVSLIKFTPGQVVRVKARGNSSEDGIVGFVCRTKPTNGDSLLVQVLSNPNAGAYLVKPGQRLSYSESHLEILPK